MLCFLQIAQGTVFFVQLAGFESFAAVHGYEEAVAFVAVIYCGAGEVADSSGGNAVGVDYVGDFVEGEVFFLTEGVDFLVLGVGVSF